MTARHDVMVNLSEGAAESIASAEVLLTGGSDGPPESDLPPESASALLDLVHRAVLHTLEAEDAPDAEISVTLLGDAEIRAMNREYLSRDDVTDVIAFSLGEEPGVGGAGDDEAHAVGEEAGAVGEEAGAVGRAGRADAGGPGLLGDVYIGLPQAARQAREVEISLEEEVARLAIHGTLHVLGHDHPEGEDRSGSPMYELQERLLGDVRDHR